MAEEPVESDILEGWYRHSNGLLASYPEEERFDAQKWVTDLLEWDRDRELGFQAQCQGCEWASILHLDEEQAAEDAEIHQNVYSHRVTVLAAYRLEQPGVSGD
jgi:hypothetical protein